jgi:hypothetical protein
LTAIRITDGGLKKLIREAPASHSREQKGGYSMIMTNATRAELELIQLILTSSEADNEKVKQAVEVLARILK